MYGQQFPSPIASAAKWIFFGFFGVILMGFLLGADLKDATWLNPGIAAAQAEKTRMETAHQKEMNKLQEQLTAAQTEAEIQAIRREQGRLDAQYQHDVQILAQDVANKQRMADTVINLVIFAGTTASIITALGGLILVIAKAITILRTAPNAMPITAEPRALPEMQVIRPLPERRPHEPLETPQILTEALEQLHDRRVAERYQELKQQKEASVLAARMKAVMDTSRMSKEGYNKLPLAGD